MLTKSQAEEILAAALEKGGDFAELFCEDTYSTNLGMVSGRVETAVSGRDYGVGIRIFSVLILFTPIPVTSAGKT